MESRKTEKTQVYIDSLKNLIERKSFDEQWEGDDLKYGMRNGKENLLFLEKIRDQELTFREILNEPGKEWWDGIYIILSITMESLGHTPRRSSKFML
jgi:hypothetical protein